MDLPRNYYVAVLLAASFLFGQWYIWKEGKVTSVLAGESPPLNILASSLHVLLTVVHLLSGPRPHPHTAKWQYLLRHTAVAATVFQCYFVPSLMAELIVTEGHRPGSRHTLSAILGLLQVVVFFSMLFELSRETLCVLMLVLFFSVPAGTMIVFAYQIALRFL